MKDKDWVKHLRTINDPVILLKELNKAFQWLGIDPYYSDLWDEVYSAVEKVLAKNKKENPT